MPTSHLTIEVLLTDDERRRALTEDARRGLTSQPKALSPVWFYDDHGSVLFDEITRLPEYYPTRAERRLLAAHAADIAEHANADTLIELGSGTSDKTRLLLDAMSRLGLRRYAPLDVSRETLVASADALTHEYPELDIHAVVGDFHRHLDTLPAGRSRLVAFLGSTIGNLVPAERHRFLFDLDCTLRCQDHLLLGVDLVKERTRLVAAYDDALGVTAAFNRNALRVLNAELGAHFVPELFDHVAVWDDENQWIEMCLRSSIDQDVAVDALGVTVHFDRGEVLRTEVSAKFTLDGIADELAAAGFVVDEIWDEPGEFALVLAHPHC